MYRQWRRKERERWAALLADDTSAGTGGFELNGTRTAIDEDAAPRAAGWTRWHEFHAVLWLIEPSDAIVEPELRRHAKLLSSLLLFTMGLGLVALVLTMVAPGAGPDIADRHLLTTLGSLTLLAGVYYLSRTRHTKAAAMLTVAIVLAATSVADALAPGQTFLLAFQVLAGVLAGVFLSPRFTAAVFGATVVVQVCMHLFLAPFSGAGLLDAVFFVIIVGVTVVTGASLHEMDLDQIRSQTQVLAHQAAHDALTKLPNRAAALESLSAASARAARSSRPMCVVFVDLESFKAVNDTLGHEAGDRVLCAVAERLLASVRAGDVVARLGGDEFLIIAEDLGDSVAARPVVEWVLGCLGQSMALDGTTIKIGAVAGVAFSSGQTAPRELLRMAAFALYRAKADATSRIGFYDQELESELLNKADIELNLDATLRRGGDELRLCYQPIVDATTGELVAVEALIRWYRPDIGLLMPDAFIPIAEKSRLIVDLDRWVMREAARQVVEWSSVPRLSRVRLSVNISGRHVLDARLVDHVKAALSATGLESDRFVLEMTETMLVADVDRAAAQLNQIRKLGVGIAVDDFGTGFASVAHLRGLPISEIKIDRSLVADMCVTGNASIVKLVHDIARHLDAQTVAEGVETRDEQSALQEIGCNALQGYLFARPLAPDALVEWAEGRAGREAAAMAGDEAGAEAGDEAGEFTGELT